MKLYIINLFIFFKFLVIVINLKNKYLELEYNMENKLSLTLTKQTTVLDGIKCYEKVDTHALDLLINSSLLKDTFSNPFVSYPNKKVQLQKYKQLITNGMAEVVYKKSNNNPFGRCNPLHALGLFSLRKHVRYVLSRAYYVDVDIKNAHASILYQLCEHNNIKCDMLKDYVLNRSKYFTIINETYKVTDIESKNLFIRMLYGGSPKSWFTDNKITAKCLPFITQFKKEFDTIAQIILKNNKEIKQYVTKNKDEKNIVNYNLAGSVCAFYLQEYEVRILTEAYKYGVDNGYIINNICVLCADGLMIEKHLFKKELLLTFSELVKQKFDLDLTFTVKEMDSGYTIEELENSQINDTDYDKMKRSFEKTHFKILDPFMYATIRETGSLILQGRTDFINVNEDLTFMDNNGKNVSFVSIWLKDAKKRVYNKIQFLPMQETPADTYNTFIGYAVLNTKLMNTDIENSLIMNHVKNVLCNNNEDMYKYFINFMANMIQSPHKKTNTALIIKSLQGVGKDTFFNWFGNNIIGKEYFFNEDNLELVFGKFNSCIENKILIILNEASGKDTFIINEKIKNAITREYNVIEHKGLKPYEIINTNRYIYLSNNDNPLKIPHDNRRFCGMECNSAYANNKEYFKALYEEINSRKYDRSIYEYLMKIDIENYDFTGIEIKNYNGITKVRSNGHTTLIFNILDLKAHLEQKYNITFEDIFI